MLCGALAFVHIFKTIVRVHLKQGSRRIGCVHLYKRKNIGETLAVEWNIVNCAINEEQFMSPVGFHALNAGGVQVRGLPSDLMHIWEVTSAGIGILLQD